MTRAEWLLDNGMPMFEVKPGNDEQEFCRALFFNQRRVIHDVFHVLPSAEGNRILSTLLYELVQR